MPRSRAVRRVLAVVVLLVVLGGCSSGPNEPGPNDGATLDFTSRATIVVDDNGISPEETAAEVGDALTVVNRGTKDHGLTSTSVDTGTLRPGESTTVFLTQAGTVELHDRSDSSHTARIVVTVGADQ